MDESSDFRSQLYTRVVNGQKQYVYAFAGTNISSIKDWLNNITQVVGFSKQYDIAINNARYLDRYIGSSSLTFVGHSLGGGLAIASALATNGSAVTFNPAWVSIATVLHYNLRGFQSIRNNIVFDEFLDVFQRVAGRSLGLQHVEAGRMKSNFIKGLKLIESFLQASQL